MDLGCLVVSVGYGIRDSHQTRSLLCSNRLFIQKPFATRLATYIVAIAATCRTNSATRKMLHHHYSRDKKHVNVATIEIGNWLQLRLVIGYN